MAAQEEEQSMEEILQSIKKIIAEDEDDVESVAAVSNDSDADDTLEITDIDELPEETPAAEENIAEPEVLAAPEPSGQDDIDAMFDVVEIEPEPAAAAQEAGLEEIAEALEDDDILELTEEVEDDDGLAGFEAPEAVEPVAAIEEAPAAAVAQQAPAPAASAESLLSNEAASQAASALAQLKQPAAAPAGEKLSFRSGVTVEDLVLEALRPMLKDWLNSELPATVERMVAEEIKRLSN